MIDKVEELKVFKNELEAERDQSENEMAELADQIERERVRYNVAEKAYNHSHYESVSEDYVVPLEQQLRSLKDRYDKVCTQNNKRITSINALVANIDASIRVHG